MKVKHSPRFSVLSSLTEENVLRTSLPGTPSFGDKKRTILLPGFTISLVWRHADYSRHTQISVFQIIPTKGFVVLTASIM